VARMVEFIKKNTRQAAWAAGQKWGQVLIFEARAEMWSWRYQPLALIKSS
jgi:hypothetical protein